MPGNGIPALTQEAEEEFKACLAIEFRTARAMERSPVSNKQTKCFRLHRECRLEVSYLISPPEALRVILNDTRISITNVWELCI